MDTMIKREMAYFLNIICADGLTRYEYRGYDKQEAFEFLKRYGHKGKVISLSTFTTPLDRKIEEDPHKVFQLLMAS